MFIQYVFHVCSNVNFSLDRSEPLAVIKERLFFDTPLCLVYSGY
jgi:hypothetical protein